MAYLANAKPTCPHCTSDDTELQISSSTREVYLCTSCSKTFEVAKDRRFTPAPDRRSK